MNLATSSEQTVIDRFLTARGLPGVRAGGGNAILSVLARRIEDHSHFRELLSACEPQLRHEMYEALRPHLLFRAHPLDFYERCARERAENMKLPVLLEDGKLRGYEPIEVRIAQDAVDEQLAQGVLTLVCRKCTKEAKFPAENVATAIKNARDEGWTYDELSGEGRETCPACL